MDPPVAGRGETRSSQGWTGAPWLQCKHYSTVFSWKLNPKIFMTPGFLSIPALRLFIRLDSNRPTARQASHPSACPICFRKRECTSMYMGVSPAPNQNKDGSRCVSRLKFYWNHLQQVKCSWDTAIHSYPWRLDSVVFNNAGIKHCWSYTHQISQLFIFL